MTEVEQLELRGRFKEAEQMLQGRLHSSAAAPNEISTLQFELDRLSRIRLDFTLSRDALFEGLRAAVKDVSVDEMDRWIREGRFAARDVDGQQRFMRFSVPNLFFRYPDLSRRRIPAKDDSRLELKIWESCVAIKAAARVSNRCYVLPKRFKVSMALEVQRDAAPAGERLKAWLPVPRSTEFQTGLKLVTSSSPVIHLTDGSSAIRSVYLEQDLAPGRSCRFQVEYEYTAFGVCFQLEPARAQLTSGDEETSRFTAPAPHVRFTQEMRELAGRIAGAESNPVLKAKKFYDWIAENISYSYAVEYSTVRDLGEYCRERRYGDCGQAAFLFMTLCRLSGIPARWASGWSIFPGCRTNHDWTEVYLAPWGWVPVDPYMGMFAMRYAKSLTPAQKREIRDFYFGGLDQYRMAANADHCQPLTPAKTWPRSDNVDFQRGEVECRDRNIYFDKFTYTLTDQTIPSTP